MSKKSIGLLAALSANVMWGFMSIPLRLIKSYDADQILYYRIIVSFLISSLVVVFFNRKNLKTDIAYLSSIKGRDFSNLAILIVVSGVFITLNWFTFIYVVNSINLKSAAFAYMICPLITALGGFVLLKEELSKIKVIAIAIAVVSIFILATGSVHEVLWSIVTAAFYAFFLIIQRKIQSINKLNMLAFQMIVALGLIIPLFFVFPQPIPVELSFWVNIVIISAFFTVLPLLLSLIALTSLPSSTVGILIYINPVVAFSVAFFYFNERIQANQLFAYGLLVCAVVIFNFKIIKESFFKFSKSSIKTNQAV
ncbi:EamA family transporter [Pedobacter arcticus]|uniref:EamA family transporter n=1 Tax=Pedobacter arcticus TaxID=752140 RepID=UPI00031BEF19|nr:EamA family transporter [Pedobacter arcticus]